MKHNNILLTVNILTYNHAQYITKCIETILSQKTNFDFIIRIFDDCSTDGTTEICQQYVDKYTDIIELHITEKNEGPVKNGVRSYTGINTPYYLFIEGDDFLLNKNFIQKAVSTLEMHKDCSFVMGNTINLVNGEYVSPHPCLKTGIYTKLDFLNNPLKYMFSNLASRVVRTECIKFDNEHPEFYLFDITQLYELIKQGNMYFINETFTCYNITNMGVSSGASLFTKITENARIFEQYNRYTEREFETNLAIYFCQDISWYYTKEVDKIKSSDGITKDKKISLKNIKHYLLPPILLDFFNLPRDISRKIKALINKENF